MLKSFSDLQGLAMYKAMEEGSNTGLSQQAAQNLAA